MRAPRSIASPSVCLGAVATLFVLLALARPIDHDESQYVAAAVLTARGLIPYRDFAYLQTPLQPFLLAPVAMLAGPWTWPALRIANALLGGAVVALVYRAAREGGARIKAALACALLFAGCDILLFSIGTARNDALPAACLAGALWPILRAERGGGGRLGAAIAGALLASAAAAKISYAMPAVAYGIYALLRRGHRPTWVALGAVPMLAFVAWTFADSPQGFLFGTIIFPDRAPTQYYLALGRPWKLSVAAKAIDVVKFLALGAALPALVAVALRGWRARRLTVLDWLIIAGFAAALLPEPTWRQYLLPVLPPLFVRLAIVWDEAPPSIRIRWAFAVFAAAGLVPSGLALVHGGAFGAAMRDSRSIGAAGVEGPVATLSPQLLPAARTEIDPRFATGPFYFRSHGLLDPAAEQRLHLIAALTLNEQFASIPPGAILIGGEGPSSSGDAALDGKLERWAITHHWRRIDIPGGRFRLYLRPKS